MQEKKEQKFFRVVVVCFCYFHRTKEKGKKKSQEKKGCGRGKMQSQAKIVSHHEVIFPNINFYLIVESKSTTTNNTRFYCFPCSFVEGHITHNGCPCSHSIGAQEEEGTNVKEMLCNTGMGMEEVWSWFFLG